jgi:hypothetical protein
MGSDLRDEIAVAAMSALIHEEFYTRNLPPHDQGQPFHERLARMAYDIASAMLQARIEHADESFRSDVSVQRLH